MAWTCCVQGRRAGVCRHGVTQQRRLWLWRRLAAPARMRQRAHESSGSWQVGLLLPGVGMTDALPGTYLRDAVHGHAGFRR